MSDPLPELMGVKELRAELGVTRAGAEAIMRCLPIVKFEGFERNYVRRADVARLLDESTEGDLHQFDRRAE